MDSTNFPSSSSSFAASETTNDKAFCLILHLGLTCHCKSKDLTEEPISMNQEVDDHNDDDDDNDNDNDDEDDDRFVEVEDRCLIEQVEDLCAWPITKVLKKSDVNGSSRLLIAKSQVLVYIAPFFTETPSKFCEDGELRVMVFDVDTRTENTLVIKKWKTKSFVLVNNWKKDFVNRRSLMVDDKVGLRWDNDVRRLEFRVLRRSHE